MLAQEKFRYIQLLLMLNYCSIIYNSDKAKVLQAQRGGRERGEYKHFKDYVAGLEQWVTFWNNVLEYTLY